MYGHGGQMYNEIKAYMHHKQSNVNYKTICWEV